MNRIGRTAAIHGAIALAALGLALPAFADGPFAHVHIATSRAKYTGRGCPVNVVFTARIAMAPLDRPIAFNYHWERNDGERGPMRVAHARPGQATVVVREYWRVGRPGQHRDAAETLVLDYGFTHERHASRTVPVICR